MIKYFFEYNDVEGVLHRAEIDDPNYTGSPIEVSGYVEHEYLDVDDILNPIHGSALRVHLDANVNLTFNDLYSEEERTFKVTYYRDSIVKFIGFINPDGLYQDWVNDHWQISLDASDGLGYLENLAYVDNDGLQILGIESEIKIIAKALKRCGLELPIYTKIRTRYKGLSNSLDGLSNVKIAQERFQRTDDTIMSCKEVIDSILNKYGACICQYNGAWFIYDLFSIEKGNVNFYKYDSTGSNGTNETINIGGEIGSQINDFYPHHCNANQRIEISPTLRKLRIVYKYGLRKSIISNPDLINNGTTIPNWTINDSAAVSLPNRDSVRCTRYAGNTGQRFLTSDASAISIDTVLDIKFTYKGGVSQAPTILCYISLDDGVDNYWIGKDLTWNNSSTILDGSKFNLSPSSVINTIKFKTPPTPISGDIVIYFDFLSTDVEGTYTDLYYAGITPLELEEAEEQQLPEGEYSDSERTDIKSSIISDNIEIYNADSDVRYVGTIFKNDGVTATTLWQSISGTDQPIITEAALIRLTNKNAPQQVFSGDIYGYVKPFGIINIDGINGDFVFKSWNYNTKTNVTSMELIQFYKTYPGNIDSVITLDYGDTTTPTIN